MDILTAASPGRNQPAYPWYRQEPKSLFLKKEALFWEGEFQNRFLQVIKTFSVKLTNLLWQKEYSVDKGRGCEHANIGVIYH